MGEPFNAGRPFYGSHEAATERRGQHYPEPEAEAHGIRAAPLPPGSPAWAEIEGMTWQQVEQGARQNLPGFRTIKKLLLDRRFDR